MENHSTDKIYTVDGLAYEVFSTAHDELVDRKRATDNENLKGVFAKSRGYLARLAMIKDALEQAITIVMAEGEPPAWSCEVMESSVESAAAIIRHLNDQKEIMMGIGQGI